MTVGKVTKKDSRVINKTYNFMKKNTNNLTLKDFAELIEFMNESDDRTNNATQPAGRQASRPVLGLGHYLSQPSRLNNSTSAGAPRQRTAVTYKRNDLPAPAAPEKKKENDADRNPLESAESRQSAGMH